ncbi:MAG: aldolase/citrate lyase family protein [Bryobacteraceae bacterium]
MKNRIFGAAMAAALLLTPMAFAQSRQYNTTKQKLAQGKKVFGGTVSSSDPEIYCAMATAGFDFLWIEMQHSPLSYHEVATMVRGCKTATAIPFIRVPDAVEGDIQKAVDLGALGIIVPMVDTVEKAQNAVKFAKYPPIGRRSQGGGQYGFIWGSDYRATANDNIMIVAMIENPAGVAIAEKIASVPGIDAVFIASTDLGSFMGKKQGEPEYEAAVIKARDAILKAGKKVGGPAAWRDREGYAFFQSPGETSLIRSGAQVALGTGGVDPRERRGIAPIEGSEHTGTKK